jgi:tetratricopeptide (TPR) repeat protein
VGIQLKARSKQCQELYETQDAAGSLRCYKALLADFPKHPDAIKIKFNMSLAAENARQIEEAIAIRKELISDSFFSGTPEGKRSVFALGRLYMNIGMYPESAEYFEKYANEFPGESDSLAALNNAAIFREASGDIEKAVEDNKKYQSIASKQKVEKQALASAFFRVAQIREREGNLKKTQIAYEQYIRDYSKEGTTEMLLLSKTWLASNLWKQNKKEDAIKACQEVIRITDDYIAKAPNKSMVAEQLNSGLDAAAQCQFYIAEKGYESFLTLKPPSSFDKEKLASWLENIKKTRDDANIQYLKIKDYGSKEWTLASLERIGMMSFQFSTLLLKAPLPTEVEYDTDGDGKPEKIKLKGETLKQVEDAVRAQLGTIAEPIRTDAIKAFSTCVEGSVQTNWYNEWSVLCEEHLNQLDPESWPITSEWIVSPTSEPFIFVAPPPLPVLR